MDGFCLNWEDSKPGRKIPFSILDQFKIFFFPWKQFSPYFALAYFSFVY